MIGSVIGNYRVVEKLGEGGMGAVYKAVDLMLEREVALKILRPGLAGQPELAERFRTEAVILAKLNHPHIATLYGLSRDGDRLLMAMEFVNGETLDRVVERRGRIEPAVAVHWCGQVLQAMEYAHRRGVVHRDIKPANLMVTEDDDVKVMDFGIARVLGTAHQTQLGHVIGTASYMAPEQIRGQEVDGRTDLYALGIVLYQLVTGLTPFRGPDEFAVMTAQVTQMPVPPTHLVEGLPAWLEQAVLQAMAKSPADRFATAGEFRRALFSGVGLAVTPTEARAALDSARLPGDPTDQATVRSDSRRALDQIAATPAPAGQAPKTPPARQATPAARPATPPARQAPKAPSAPPAKAATPPARQAPAPPAAPPARAIEAPPAVAPLPAEKAVKASEAVPPPSPRRSSSPQAAAGIVIVALLGVVAAWWLWPRPAGSSSPGTVATVETQTPAPADSAAPTGSPATAGAPAPAVVVQGNEVRAPATATGRPAQVASPGTTVASSQPATPAPGMRPPPSPYGRQLPDTRSGAANSTGALPPVAQPVTTPPSAAPAVPPGAQPGGAQPSERKPDPAAAVPVDAKTAAEARPPAAAPPAVPEDRPAAGEPVVYEIQYLVKNAGEDATLNLYPDRLTIVSDETEAVVKTVRYRSILSVTYEETRAAKPSGGLGALKGALSKGGQLFGAGKHWLTIKTDTETVVVRVGRSYKEVLQHLQRLGGITAK